LAVICYERVLLGIPENKQRYLSIDDKKLIAACNYPTLKILLISRPNEFHV